jgi:hypothetical protein
LKVKYKPNYQVVIKAGQDAAERIGKRFGAMIMTTARQSIRKGKSAPGQPPRNQTGTLKKNIIFAYDSATRSVIIGPRFLGDVSSRDAPRALELGGTSLTVRKGKRKRQAVAARPFMVPALEKRSPELPLLWENAIRKQ